MNLIPYYNFAVPATIAPLFLLNSIVSANTNAFPKDLANHANENVGNIVKGIFKDTISNPDPILLEKLVNNVIKFSFKDNDKLIAEHYESCIQKAVNAIPDKFLCLLDRTLYDQGNSKCHLFYLLRLNRLKEKLSKAEEGNSGTT